MTTKKQPPSPITHQQLITLVAASGICNLMELEKLVQPNSKIAGLTRRIHTALVDIAGMVGGKLDADWVDIGVSASNAGMKIIKKAIKATGTTQKAGV